MKKRNITDECHYSNFSKFSFSILLFSLQMIPFISEEYGRAFMHTKCEKTRDDANPTVLRQRCFLIACNWIQNEIEWLITRCHCIRRSPIDPNFILNCNTILRYLVCWLFDFSSSFPCPRAQQSFTCVHHTTIDWFTLNCSEVFILLLKFFIFSHTKFQSFAKLNRNYRCRPAAGDNNVRSVCERR